MKKTILIDQFAVTLHSYEDEGVWWPAATISRDGVESPCRLPQHSHSEAQANKYALIAAHARIKRGEFP